MRQGKLFIKWTGLAMGFLISVAGVVATAKDMTSWGLPDFAWYAIGLYIYTIFAIWIIYGLWKDNKKLESDLKVAKQYKAQSQRIDIISKEKYPSEIIRIFDDMRRCLAEIVESSDSMKEITSKLLLDGANGTPQDLYRAIHQESIDDNVNVTFTFYNHFGSGIGLRNLQENSDKWKKLVDEFEKTKSEIPDQVLKDAVMRHFMALNGDSSIRLFYRYLTKHGSNEILIQIIEPFRPLYGLLDETITRVTKGILELKLGEEPKWEMKYIQKE